MILLVYIFHPKKKKKEKILLHWNFVLLLKIRTKKFCTVNMKSTQINKIFSSCCTHKTALVQPLTSRHTNYLRRARHAGCCWSKQKLIIDILLWTPRHGLTSICQLAKNYIHQLCADTGCHLEDLSRAIADRDLDKREPRKSVLSADLDGDIYIWPSR